MSAGLRPYRFTVLLALGAFCAGYLADRTLAMRNGDERRRQTARAEKSGPIHRTEKAEGSTRAASQAEEDLRKGRVLAALLEASRDTDDATRSQRLALAAADIGPGEIVAALEMAYRFSYYARHDAIHILVARWAEFDPQGAAEYALVPRPIHPNAKSALLMLATAVWGQKDMAGAKAWALALKNPVQRAQAFAGIIDGVAQTDGARAMGMIKDLPDDLREAPLWQVVQTWADRAPEEAAQYLTQHPDEIRGGTWVYPVANAWAGQDAEAAHAWAVTLPDATARRLARGTVYPAMLAIDPEGVAAEILRLPPGPERKQALETIQQVYGAEPKDVVAFALALPPGGDRSRILQAGIVKWGNAEPETAIAAVQSWPPEWDPLESTCRHASLSIL